MDPKFSITIPAFKARYLAEAIESCLNQTYQYFEVIIVDDCSPENLGSIVSPYLKDNRVRFYRNEKNCGAVDVVDNWNICLGYCTGDYVICMGDDDRLKPCCLEEYSKLIQQYPGIGLVHGWTEIIDENGDFLSMQHPRPLFEGAMSLWWNRWNGRGTQYIGDWCFNVEQLRKEGGFYKVPLAWSSDDISAVRAAALNGVANTQVLCFEYRQNRYTISSSGNADMKMNAILKERQWYRDFIKQYESSDPAEQKYKVLLESELEQHFREKFKLQLAGFMKDNAMSVFHWLKVKSKYGLSTARVLFACKIAIESKFHGK